MILIQFLETFRVLPIGQQKTEAALKTYLHIQLFQQHMQMLLWVYELIGPILQSNCLQYTLLSLLLQLWDQTENKSKPNAMNEGGAGY